MLANTLPGVPLAVTAKKAMPTRGGPVAEVTVVFTPPYRVPFALSTWFIRESFALIFSSGSLSLIGGALRMSRSDVGAFFLAAPVLIGRPWVLLVRSTGCTGAAGCASVRDLGAVGDANAIPVCSPS